MSKKHLYFYRSSDLRHGFRKGRSCLTHYNRYVSVSSSIDSGNCIDTIYLDFEKAFDKAPHQRLLYKLQCHGIIGSLLQWIAAWLKGRKQKVHIALLLEPNHSGLTLLAESPKSQCLGHCSFSYSSTTWEYSRH